MKSSVISIVVLAGLFTTFVCHSQAPDENFDPLGEINNLPKQIRVQAEFIEMPQATYTKLMAKPRNSANDTDLRAACAKLIEAGEAGILESLCVTALPGQVATTESIAEFIYLSPLIRRPGLRPKKGPKPIRAPAPRLPAPSIPKTPAQPSKWKLKSTPTIPLSSFA